MTADTMDGLSRLERSCGAPAEHRDWFRVAPEGDGLLRIEADLAKFRYAPHRHDTYAIGITTAGVQSFNYRRARRDCLPGQVIVLHPDERHDGQPGTHDGFRYRMIYLEPAELRMALGDRATALPFLKSGHETDVRLRKAVVEAVADLGRPTDALERSGLIQEIADALLRLDTGAAGPRRERTTGVSSRVLRARDLLRSDDAISMADMEHDIGLSRFEIARQFRRAFGTSPYRYHLMRRLERARSHLSRNKTIASVAHDYGFADQSHFTRQFRNTYGLTPGEWLTMTAAAQLSPFPRSQARDAPSTDLPEVGISAR